LFKWSRVRLTSIKITELNEEEEEEPNGCYLVFYYTYDRLNMIRAALCPSSGAHDYSADYHMGRLILRLLMVGGLVQVGFCLQSGYLTISNLRIRRPMW
jgi:hypothetical protein